MSEYLSFSAPDELLLVVYLIELERAILLASNLMVEHRRAVLRNSMCYLVMPIRAPATLLPGDAQI